MYEIQKFKKGREYDGTFRDEAISCL